MKFPSRSAEQLLGEMTHIPASGTDATSARVDGRVGVVVARLRKAGTDKVLEEVEKLLGESPDDLDVLRLFTGDSQDITANKLAAQLNRAGNYGQFRRLAKSEPKTVAKALDGIGTIASIKDQLTRSWDLGDVLVERYRMSRGRAIAGQARGRALEDNIEIMLNAIQKRISMTYHRGGSFTGANGKKAKADFAIEGLDEPRIVIEAKGYEATGSKLTDILGDVRKIHAARNDGMFLFLVTDGSGWANRQSDMHELVNLRKEGQIQAIYTRKGLPELAEAIVAIMSDPDETPEL